MILIKDARLSIDDSRVSDILIDRGKIIRIGRNIEAEGAEVIEAGGLLTTSGLVGYCSPETEGAVVRFTPGIRAIEELDLFGRELIFYLNQGITSIVVHPKNNNLISGSVCVVKTHEALIEDYVIKEDAAIRVILGGDEGLGERMTEIRSFIELLGEYRKGREMAGREGLKVRLTEKILRKRHPVIFRAESSSAVLDAVRLIERYNLSGVVETPVENRHTLKAVEDEGIYIIRERRDAPLHNLEELREALEFSRRIARFLNIDHRVGEIGVGMDADIVIWEEDPLEAVSVIIDGNLIGRINR